MEYNYFILNWNCVNRMMQIIIFIFISLNKNFVFQRLKVIAINPREREIFYICVSESFWAFWNVTFSFFNFYTV